MSLYQIQTMSKKETTFGKERAAFKSFDSIESFELDNPNDVRRLYELKSTHCTSSIIRENLGRGTNSFTYSDTISLDFDDNKTINEIHSLLGGYVYIVYGSKSNQIDKEVSEEFEVNGKKVTKKVIKNNERFHVDLYLDNKITTSEIYSKLFEKLIEKFGSDKNAKNPDRIISSSLDNNGQLSEINKQIIENEIERFNNTFKDSKFYNVDDLLEEIKFEQNKILVQDSEYLTEKLNNTPERLENAIEYLYGKGSLLDHDERLLIAMSLYTEFGDQGKSILLKIKNSEGTKRCWDSVISKKYKNTTNGGSICKIAGKLGWIDTSKFCESAQEHIDITYNYGHTIASNADKIKEYSDRKKNLDENLSKQARDAEISQLDKNIKSLENENSKLEKEIKLEIKQAEKIQKREDEKNLIKEQEIKNGNIVVEKKLKTDMTPTRENIVPFFNSFIAKIKNSSNVVIEQDDVCLITSLSEAAKEFENIGEYVDPSKIGSKFVPYFQRWRESPLRREIDADKIVWKAHEPLLDGEINLFRPKYAVKRVECTDEVKKVIDRFLFESASDSNLELCEWLKNWMAAVIQYYFTGVLVINVGGFGTGKSTLGLMIEKLLGSASKNTKDDNSILGNFNASLVGKSFVNVEELPALDNAKTANGFKSLITSRTITIEPKGRDAYEIKNILNWYISSNNLKIYTDLGSRRFVAIKSSDKFDEKINPESHNELFNAIYDIIGDKNSEGNNKLGQLLDYFLKINVDTNMFLNNLPNTVLKNELRSDSLSFVENFMIEVYNNNGIVYDESNKYFINLYTNKILCDKGGLNYGRIVSTKMIYDVYLQYYKDRRTYMTVVKDFNNFSNIRHKDDKALSYSVRTHEFDSKMIYDYFKLKNLSDLLVKPVNTNIKQTTTNDIQSNKIEEVKTNVIEPVIIEKPIKIEEVKQVIEQPKIEIKQELNEVIDSDSDVIDNLESKLEKLIVDINNIESKKYRIIELDNLIKNSGDWEITFGHYEKYIIEKQKLNDELDIVNLNQLKSDKQILEEMISELK